METLERKMRGDLQGDEGEFHLVLDTQAKRDFTKAGKKLTLSLHSSPRHWMGRYSINSCHGKRSDRTSRAGGGGDGINFRTTVTVGASDDSGDQSIGSGREPKPTTYTM